MNFAYRVEGLAPGVSYEDTGLPAVKLTSPAVLPYPDVNNYSVIPPKQN
ncbi:MAG: hypothetical protein U5K51_05775 [Flavobacteriaceae bacterium]|nr:hypothetical protein [Flavobacteriaceae bacterium]